MRRGPRAARHGSADARRLLALRDGWQRAAALLALAGLSWGCSLAGDVTPPPALATAQAAAPLPTRPPVAQLDAPQTSANLIEGELLYADRCAACHGSAGLGDGEMADQLSFPPAALADPELARSVSPETWFRIVTEGRLDRLMPPFSSLTDQQRWDVVGYALSLSTSREQLQAGEALFADHCSDCHTSASFELDYLQATARSDHYAVIAEGRGEMPAFASALDPEQLWALAGYLQSLGWQTQNPAEPAVAQPATSQTSVTGRVSQGTAGADLPDDLQVRIVGFDGEQQVLDEQVPVDAQGAFRLEGVEAAPGRLFFATLEYQDVQYRSEIAHAPAEGSPLDLPLMIYESSADPAPIRVERLHLLIDFPSAGLMRVLQLWVVGNSSDQVITPALRVPLPAAARNVGFEQGDFQDRYQQTAEGFVDHEPLPPGSGIDQLVFGFDVPLEGGLEYRQPLEHPVQAVTVLVPENGPRLSGLIDEGVRDLGGVRMHSYAASGFEAGDSLTFRVAGPGGLSGPTVTLAVGGAALLLALYVAYRAGWVGRPASSPASPASSAAPADQGTLLRRIAQLDAEYEAGRLDQEQWEQRRAALKQQALDLMRGGDG